MTGYHEFIFHREPRRGLLLDFFFDNMGPVLHGKWNGGDCGLKKSQVSRIQGERHMFQAERMPKLFCPRLLCYVTESVDI